ncbi:MAG TPA: DUF6134 family protein [Xanthomonadales bacterium]|nr:DUF6134 family protein [Xanthomonadales bacterium]
MASWMQFSAFDWSAAFIALGALITFAIAGWLISLGRKDVSIVDSMWSLMFLISLAVYMSAGDHHGWRALLILSLAAIWSIRLSAYITWRNHGEGEDHRYQEIRANNQPNFEFKSLYIVFGLQALLAWLISLPLLAAASSDHPFGWVDALGIALWTVGIYFEAIGDAQLARFKRDPSNSGKVMNQGLWRYTRHPNYFGEFTLQWGFFLLAVAAGGAWTIFAPMMISFLLLRVSGVTLLEKDISERRPGYREYAQTTNAFFPGRPKSGPDHALFIGLLLCTSLFWSPSYSEATQDSEQQNLEWNFDVLVDDKLVGNHRFVINREGNKRTVSSITDLEYRVLFITFYNYEHESNETWEEGCLREIKSSTDANGKLYEVEGSLGADGFVVSSKGETSTLANCISTFAYWNPDFINAPQLLNAQTGKIVDVELTEQTVEAFSLGNEMIQARRYRIDAGGEVEIDIWYTPEGRWVGLATQPRDGRSLRYVLQ